MEVKVLDYDQAHKMIIDIRVFAIEEISKLVWWQKFKKHCEGKKVWKKKQDDSNKVKASLNNEKPKLKKTIQKFFKFKL